MTFTLDQLIKRSHTLGKPKIIVSSQDDFAKAAAQGIIDAIEEAKTYKSGEIVVNLPSGSTPIGAYKYLAEHFDKALWEGVSIRALDTRLGDNQFGEQIRAFGRSIGIPESHIETIDGLAPCPDIETARFRDLVESTPADVSILGIGPRDGHIAFVFPGSDLNAKTSRVQLPDAVINQQKGYSGTLAAQGAALDEGITQGPNDLLRLDNENMRVVLLANKAEASQKVTDALQGPISMGCPASLVRLKGANANIILSEEVHHER